MEEARIGFIQSREVLTIDRLFVPDAALGDALQQHVHGRLQVHHEIGLRAVDVELGAHLLVQRVFGFIERDAREELVFVEQVIRHDDGREQILLFERRELLRALKEEVELRGKRARARIAIEALEKRILHRLLEHEIRREAHTDAACEARLADTDGPFHHDETV